MPSINHKNIIRGLLLASASLVICLLLADLCIRIFYKSSVDTELLTARLQVGSIKDMIQPSRDPALHYEMKPDLEMDHFGATVSTSPDGIRISGQASDLPLQRIRLAVLGDSTSFGWRVDYNDSYPEIYRQHMERTANVPIELKNASVPGYNSSQELLVFLNKVIPYEPDLLILHYDHNDSYPNDHFHSATYLHPTYGDNPLSSALVKLSLRTYRRWQYAISLSYDQGQHEHIGGYIVSGPLYDAHLQALQTIATRTRELGIPTIVVVFTSDAVADERMLTDPDYVTLHANLVARLVEMKFHVLDLFPLHQARLRKMGWSNLSEWWVSNEEPPDRHPNRDGHQFISEQLVEYTHRQPELLKIFKNSLPR